MGQVGCSAERHHHQAYRVTPIHPGFPLCTDRYRTISERLPNRQAALQPIGHGLPGVYAHQPMQGRHIMIRTAVKAAAVVAGFVFLASSVLHADSFGPSNDRRHGHSRPSVKTYATGLTSPRGLTFGPD